MVSVATILLPPVPPPPFALAANGTTIVARDGLAVGSKGMFNSVEYTYVDADMLKNMVRNADLSRVVTTGITDMNRLFHSTSFLDNFNDDISAWDVSSVTDMESMFEGAGMFNQDISAWDVSAVTNMRSMFDGAGAFNQPISDWDVGAVTNMRSMFSTVFDFNQDIGMWDVSSVTDMGFMFSGNDVFNQDIRNWDVSSVTDMEAMFLNARAFDQDISGWTVGAVELCTRFAESASASWTVEKMPTFPAAADCAPPPPPRLTVMIVVAGNKTTYGNAPFDIEIRFSTELTSIVANLGFQGNYLNLTGATWRQTMRADNGNRTIAITPNNMTSITISVKAGAFTAPFGVGENLMSEEVTLTYAASGG